MEHALAERTYKELFDNTLDGVEVIDIATGRIVQANKAAAAMFGFDSPDDMIGVDLLDYIPSAEDRARIVTMTAEMPKKDVHSIMEVQFRRRDGQQIWVAAMGTKVEFDGRLALLASLRDITAHKLSQQELRSVEERQLCLLNTSNDLILIVQDWKIAFVNRKFEEVTGLARETLLGLPIMDMTHPNDRQDVAERYQRILKGERPLSHGRTYKGLGKGRKTRWGEIREIPFTWEGKPAVMTLIQDITEQKETEEALKASEERYRGIFDESVVAIYVFDTKKKFINANQAGTDLLGYSREELLSMSIGDVDTNPAAVLSAYAELLSGGRLINYEHSLRRKDGTIITVLNNSRPLTDANGKVVGMLSTLIDITERKRSQKTLEVSEQRNRLLVENANEGIMVVQDGIIKFPNPKALDILKHLGYTEQDIETQLFMEFIHPEDRQMVLGSHLRRLAGEEFDHIYQFRAVGKHGEIRWMELNAALLPWDGKPATLVFLNDVTERREAEEALKASEERFRALIENAAEGIMIVDPDGRLSYRSLSASCIGGYEAQELVGKHFADFIHPDDLQNAGSLVEFLNTNLAETVSCEVRCKNKDGTWSVVEATGRNLLHDPNINGYVVNYRDITDHKRTEEAMRESEERFRNLVETSSDWVWEIDTNSVYTYVSPKASNILGYEAGSILGKTPFDFMAPKEARRMAKLLTSFIKEHEPFALIEKVVSHIDGHSVVLETSGVPFFDSERRLLGYRGINRDITERKKVAKQLERSLRKLEKTMEATIQAITYTIETRDPYTTGHQRRVTQLACAIANEMGLPSSQVNGIRVAGLLHDIGKIAIPAEILSKPGQLTEIEFSMIKAHPKVGFDILRNIDFEWPVARIVVQHHERLNGSGYPYGILGKDILLEAKILAVADVVEAMSSYRPYRPALGIEKAIQEISRGDGTIYDPSVVRACAKIITQGGFKFED